MKTLITFLLLASSALAADMKVHRDLPYSQSKSERQTLDVYAPAEGKGCPIVFWIHGGGWQTGSKTSVQRKPKAFVDKGFVFVSTNYRLLPDATINQMGEDVARAIRWVHDHAKEYGGDPNTILVMGHSAGAQLAALVCTDDRYLKSEGLSFSIIKGCVPVDGDTYDVPMQIATVKERIANIYRRKFGDEKSQKNLSPVTHVAKGKNIPPFLILHVADHPETKGQSQRLAKALKDAGVSARTYPAEGKNHGTINSELGLPGDKPTVALYEFLDVVLAKHVPADDAKDEAIKMDRKRIEGTWRIVALEVNGNKAKEEDAKKLTVVNGPDGTWSVRFEDKEISKGTSSFDPTQKPKTIDFTPTEGDARGKLHLGIYELGKDARRLCFAPSGQERPTEFSAEAGSGHVLVTFRRVKSP